ncbi:hypothetical protein VPHK406_0092 [Vibrio phage K406]
MEQKYLVKCDSKKYWKEKGKGSTHIREDAHQYTYEEAIGSEYYIKGAVILIPVYPYKKEEK